MSQSTLDISEKIQEKRGRGRPIGSGKKLASMRNWQPKTWTPEYEMIVLASVKGISNKDIGEMFEKGEVQIGNILNCQAAEEYREKLRKKLESGFQVTYKGILEKATKRLDTFLNNDKTFEDHPIASVDRAMRAMEMIDAKLRANSATTNTNNNLVFATEASVDRLLKAMNKSKESDKLHDNREAADLRGLTPIRAAG